LQGSTILCADCQKCFCSKKALEDAAEQVSTQHEQSEPWLQLQHINGYTGEDSSHLPG